jgi:hypothetical protein
VSRLNVDGLERDKAAFDFVFRIALAGREALELLGVPLPLLAQAPVFRIKAVN